MRAALVWLWAGAAVGACAHRVSLDEAAQRSVEQSSTTLVRSGGASFKASSDRARRCDELERQPVSSEEEASWGDLVALSVASKSRGVVIETGPMLADEATPNPARLSTAPAAGALGPRAKATLALNRVGKGLALRSQRPTLAWAFVLIDADAPLAASGPGGTILVSTGLLKACRTEAQLAFVLAHEIAHVSLKHWVAVWSRARADGCRAAQSSSVMMGVMASMASESGTSLGPGGAKLQSQLESSTSPDSSLHVKVADDLSRQRIAAGLGPDAEAEADTVAVELLRFAGYDVREARAVLQALPDDGGHQAPAPTRTARLAAVEKAILERCAGLPVEQGRAPPLPRDLEAVTP